MERELQKMKFKNGFMDVKFRGSLLFIGAKGESWPLDENNSNAQDYNT